MTKEAVSCVQCIQCLRQSSRDLVPREMQKIPKALEMYTSLLRSYVHDTNRSLCKASNVARLRARCNFSFAQGSQSVLQTSRVIDKHFDVSVNQRNRCTSTISHERQDEGKEGKVKKKCRTLPRNGYGEMAQTVSRPRSALADLSRPRFKPYKINLTFRN